MISLIEQMLMYCLSWFIIQISSPPRSESPQGFRPIVDRLDMVVQAGGTAIFLPASAPKDIELSIGVGPGSSDVEETQQHLSL